MGNKIWIDYTKAFCMFLVYINHTEIYYGYNIPYAETIYRPFFVNLFFIVSGYLLFRKYLSLPYILFFLFFVIVPIFLIVFYAFTDKNTGAFSFSNVIKFFNDSTNVNVLIISLTYAILNTILCLLVACMSGV